VSQGIQGRGKTVPWATEEKEAGTVAAAKSWPPPLQADVQQAAVLIYGAAATDEAETLFCPSLSTCRLEEGEHRQTRGQRLVVALARVKMCLKAWMQSVLVGMQESKVRQHQEMYPVDDWYFD
jgi:hypothetical protein